MSLFSIAGSTPSDSGFELKSARLAQVPRTDGSSPSYFKRLQYSSDPDGWQADGNLKTWTLSWWMKHDVNDENSERWIYWVDGDNAPGSMGYDSINLVNHQLQYYCYVNGWSTLRSHIKLNRVFRDPSAWYHCMIVMDSTLGVAADRTKIYVNGVRETSFATNTQIGAAEDTNTDMNANTYVGASHSITTTQSYGGYLAEFYRIDGLALGPEYFGATNEDTNQWQPKNPTDVKEGVTFGMNGFYLPFSNDALADDFTSFPKYKVESFTTVETTSWTVPAGITSVEYLVVGGGGSGGSADGAGGGGGGAFRTGTLSVTPDDSLTVTVGSGGASVDGPLNGNGGGDSVFDSITSGGGGGGGYLVAGTASSGSGGGGGGPGSGFPGGGSGPYGNPGGNGAQDNGGGGGGAGATGSAGSGNDGGNGGAGAVSGITGVSLTYAGGGGGGTNDPGSAGAGGAGGGGSGAGPSYPYAAFGKMNTGGGGGGAKNTTGNASGAGGSGIVIIRYVDDAGTVPVHPVSDVGDATNTRITSHTVAPVSDTHIIGPKVGSSAIAFPGYSGADGYLTIPDSSDWDINATSDWTWEFWLYRTTTDASGDALINHADGGGNGWNMNWDGSNKIRIYNALNGTGGITATNIIPENKWTHFAMVHDDSEDTLKIYLDGVEDNSTTASSAITWVNQNVVLWIGAQDIGSGATRFFSGGYMDEIRLSNVARYTANFTPDTTEFSSDANTMLLIHSNTTMGSTTFTDSSGSPHTISALGACMHVAPKIGTGMAAFDGSGDYLNVSSGSDLAFGIEDFTIEAWVSFSVVQNQGIMLFSNSAANYSPYFQYYGGELQFGINGIASIHTFSWTPTVNTWYHVAVSRTENTSRMFIDGTQVDSDADATKWVSNGLYIGAWSSRDWNGYMDEIRVSKTARYTGAFTPSTTAFQDDVNTVLLLHMDGGGGIDPATNLPTLPGQGTYFWDASTDAIFYDAAGVPTNKSYMTFDGSGDYLSLADSADFDFLGDENGDYTVETWANFNTTASTDVIITQYEDSNKYWGLYHTHNGGVRFLSVNGGTTSIDISGGEIIENGWHHLAIVKQSLQFGLYKDGLLVASGALTAGETYTYAAPLRIADDGTGIPFDGDLDDIRLSNSARYGVETFTPSETISCDVLIIAGGGGAGGGNTSPGGGGGAGGMVTATSVSATAQAYTIVVGNGGSGGAPGVFGHDGGNSSALGQTEAIGGGGGAKDNQPGRAGGSGGGGSLSGKAGGAGNQSPGNGNAGGAGAMTGGNQDQAAGGGGGAGGAGAAASTSNGGTGGAGGAGNNNDYQTGVNQTYAGGGGGGGGGNSSGPTGSGGAGGSGGGGAGTFNTAPGHGAAHTGSGGGGSTLRPNNADTYGGNGGSGIVVIRYQSATVKATGGTITTYGSGASQYQVHTFYAPTFTPSTTPFTTDANTKLLIQSEWSEGGIGADHSNNYNYFTPVNMTVNDSLDDSPMNNFCTFNPLNGKSGLVDVLTEGNLRLGDGSSESGYNLFSTFAVSSGKWYYEYRDTSPVTRNSGVGWCDVNMTINGGGSGVLDVVGAFWYNNIMYQLGSSAAIGATLDINVIAGIAIDTDAGKIWFSHNGTWWDSQDPAAGTNPKFTAGTNPTTWMPILQNGNAGSGTVNYGQDSSFAGAVTAQGNMDENDKGDFYYTPPAGFLALCTDNLSDPLIALPTEHFGTLLWTGNDAITARTLTGTIPNDSDLVWIKDRSSGYDNNLYDSVRGFGLTGGGLSRSLVSNATYAEGSDGGGAVTYKWGYVSDTGTGSIEITGTSGETPIWTNKNSDNYVAWNWKASTSFDPTSDGTIAVASGKSNAAAGFSIVKYTGENAVKTIGHGLSVAPTLIYVKALVSHQWECYYLRSDGSDGVLFLDQDGDGEAAGSGYWNDTNPTASVFTVGVGSGTGGLTSDYVAYCFHSVEGYSKQGIYTGNGNADGPFIYTGFQPAYLLLKNTSVNGAWIVFDNKRDTYNEVDKRLFPNEGSVESANNDVDFLSNGWKTRTSLGGTNGNTNEILYLAFAESPFKTSNAR